MRKVSFFETGNTGPVYKGCSYKYAKKDADLS